MAISCNNREASEISTHVYEIQPGFLVVVKFTMIGPILADGLQGEAKSGFLRAISDLLRVPVERIELLTVQDARRKLLSVDVTVGVVANSQNSADKIKEQIDIADLGALLAALGWQDIEVSGIETSVISPSSQQSTPLPASETQKGSDLPIIVAAVVGAVVLLGIVTALSFYVLTHRRAAEKHAVQDPIDDEIAQTQTEPEAEVEPEEITDFNREIQLFESYGPEIMRLVQGTRNLTSMLSPMESSASAVHPGSFQPYLDADEIESR
jgi:hypothetical protein